MDPTDSDKVTELEIQSTRMILEQMQVINGCSGSMFMVLETLDAAGAIIPGKEKSFAEMFPG